MLKTTCDAAPDSAQEIGLNPMRSCLGASDEWLVRTGTNRGMLMGNREVAR
jgi:hypothetical protein